jgi:hypothetical protein
MKWALRIIWDLCAEYLFRIVLSFRIAATLFVGWGELTRRVLDFVHSSNAVQAWSVSRP